MEEEAVPILVTTENQIVVSVTKIANQINFSGSKRPKSAFVK